MGNEAVYRLREEVPSRPALAEHHVVLQVAIIADQWLDLFLSGPVEGCFVVSGQQHVTVDCTVLLAHLAKEAGVVRVRDARCLEQVIRQERRTYRADIFGKTTTV